MEGHGLILFASVMLVIIACFNLISCDLCRLIPRAEVLEERPRIFHPVWAMEPTPGGRWNGR